MKEAPIIDNSYVLRKHERHTGWVYVLIDDAEKVKGKFPKIKVKGSIDGFAIENCILAPYGKPGYVLPVRSEIRKQIKKEAGDRVRVVLFADNREFEVPEEIDLCLQEEPAARKFFYSLSQSEQRMYVLWITSAKRVETKADRIAKSIQRLSRRLKLYE